MGLEDYLTTQEAGRELGRSAAAVRSYARFHGLPSTRRGGRTFILRDDLARWRVEPAVAAMLRAGEVVNASRFAKS